MVSKINRALLALLFIIIVTPALAGDNLTVTQGVGTTVGADEVTRNAIVEKEQVVKNALRPDGTFEGFQRMGQQTMANSQAVVLASDQASIPVTVSGVATAANQSTIITSVQLIDDAVATTGSAITSKGYAMSGTDGTNARVIKTDTSGNPQVNVLQINGVAPSMGNGASGTGVQRVTLANDSTGVVSLATGSNTIGALTANQSVNVAQINGVTATMGNGASGTGVQRVTIANDSTGIVGLSPQTTGGLSVYKNIDLDETGVSVKGSAGQLYGYYVCNLATAFRYLKFYSKATAATVGSDTILFTVPVPAGQCANQSYEQGISFALGISAGVTTALADASTGAPGTNDFTVALFYK